MSLNETQKKHLKGLAHHLNPIVMVGQHGLRESILSELDKALEYHQLVKIKISVGDREQRKAVIEQILQHTKQAMLIQQIGNIAVLYQQNPDRPSLFN